MQYNAKGHENLIRMNIQLNVPRLFLNSEEQLIASTGFYHVPSGCSRIFTQYGSKRDIYNYYLIWVISADQWVSSSVSSGVKCSLGTDLGSVSRGNLTLHHPAISISCKYLSFKDHHTWPQLQLQFHLNYFTDSRYVTVMWYHIIYLETNRCRWKIWPTSTPSLWWCCLSIRQVCGGGCGGGGGLWCWCEFMLLHGFLLYLRHCSYVINQNA